MTTLDEDEIKRRAHGIWEQEGRPEGREFQNYMDAVSEMMAEAEGGKERPTTGPSGISSGLHPGGTAPSGGASGVGSIGTGGGATAGRPTGSAVAGIPSRQMGAVEPQPVAHRSLAVPCLQFAQLTGQGCP
jgi:hypothetical protein